MKNTFKLAAICAALAGCTEPQFGQFKGTEPTHTFAVGDQTFDLYSDGKNFGELFCVKGCVTGGAGKTLVQWRTEMTLAMEKVTGCRIIDFAVSWDGGTVGMAC